ncbi:MAG TPA: glycosyltransferase family 87 protein [Candidatus Dormibacteraeota bacterium]|nr:glycosyltransferase family 87 protein [Candidatus Dormibacteraeota bacterium]
MSRRLLSRLARPLANRRFRWLLIAVALPLPLLQYLVVTAQLSADLVNRGNEDFWVYARAAATIARGADPYGASSATTIAQNTTYIYPPLLAWLVQPLVTLDLTTQTLVGFAVLQICFFAAIAIVTRALNASWQLAALVTLAGITSYWVRRDLYEGQVDLVILALESIWFWAWVRGGRWWGGVALACGAALKVLPGVLLLLPIARRRWEMVAGVVVAGSVLFVALFRLNLEYATRVFPFLPGVVGNPESQSPASTLLRLLEPASLYGEPDRLGAWFHVLIIAMTAAFLIVTAWRLRAKAIDSESAAIEGAAAVALLPLLTPVTWGHHLVVELIPLYVLAWVAIRRRHLWLGGLTLLAWVLANPVHLLFMAAYLGGAKTPVVMNVWVELPVAGAVLVWALCLYAYQPNAVPASGLSRSAIPA